MSIGIGNEHEVLPLQAVLGANEVLRVTQDGQFVWNPDADRMIEEGDFSFSPAMPHILRALRKRTWVGLTEEETSGFTQHEMSVVKYVSKVLQEKNG